MAIQPYLAYTDSNTRGGPELLSSVDPWRRSQSRMRFGDSPMQGEFDTERHVTRSCNRHLTRLIGQQMMVPSPAEHAGPGFCGFAVGGL